MSCVNTERPVSRMLYVGPREDTAVVAGVRAQLALEP